MPYDPLACCTQKVHDKYGPDGFSTPAGQKLFTDCSKNPYGFGCIDPGQNDSGSGSTGSGGTLPGFGGPTGSGTGDTGTAAYEACRAQCEQDAFDTFPEDSAGRLAYYNSCIQKCGAAAVGAAGAAATAASAAAAGGAASCAACTGVDTPGPCITCAAAYFTNGLKHIGWNILLVALVLFGVYMLFHDEINQAAGKAAKTAKTAAEVAAM